MIYQQLKGEHHPTIVQKVKPRAILFSKQNQRLRANVRMKCFLTWRTDPSSWLRMVKIKYWIPAIFVAILISLFSTHYFSGEETARVIIPLLHWIFPGASPGILRLMHIGIRKMAHITEFGLFSITVFHGIRGGRYGWRFNWALTTLL
jgi:hypothetical protein